MEAAADLVPVQHHVIGIRLDPGIGVFQVFLRVGNSRIIIES